MINHAEYNRLLKEKQLDTICNIINGKSTVCCLPTGYGKSLCFAAPPLILDKLQPDRQHIMLVSPLKALMTDQTANLQKLGIKVAHVMPEMSDTTVQGVKKGVYSIVFLSPELVSSMGKDLVKSTIYQNSLIGITFDEVHCVVQWSSDFCPAYKASGDIVTWTDVPILCLSATLTSAMKDEVLECLFLKSKAMRTVSLPPDRPNICLDLKMGTNFNEDLKWLITELRDHQGEAPKTIIYCRTINAVSAIWLHFCTCLGERAFVEGQRQYQNRLVEQFHSNISKASYEYILSDFSKMDSSIRVLVCTIGFGLGVNMKNIRRVVHWGPSDDAMQYWQEVGRAGRDGQPSQALLFYVPLYAKNVSCDFKELLKQFLKTDHRLCFRREVLLRVSLIGAEQFEPVDADKCCTFCKKNSSNKD